MAEERVQRRLAAILAADVVGYSRLMEADEEGTRARLRKVHSQLIDPQIAADGGRVVKAMGDGILVEFSSAVDAVRNALALQSAMADHNAKQPEDQKLVFRVGINLGDVIIEGDDIHGDGVNVAARLEGLCDPGGVYVSGTVREHVEGKLDAVFGDLGEQTVKNIKRPVQVYAVSHGTKFATTTETIPAAEKASLAILPFTNMSGDPEQEYFSDGISEDIITALSRARWFRVASRNSTFAYKGTSLDVRQIAKELGVQYVLEGSVRKAGNRVRITAQLIDGKTDDHLWAERYDRELEGIFEVQDDITRSIAGAIEPQLRKAEVGRALIKRTENLNAWDVYQRGMSQMFRKNNPDNQEALRLFERAIELDVSFGPAYAGKADACYFLVHFAHVQDHERYVAMGVEAARHAVELDEADYAARCALGRLFMKRGEYEEAKVEIETAIRLNPFSGEPHRILGRILNDLGDYPNAARAMEAAVRVCPHDPAIGIIMARLAEAYYQLGEYEQAVEWARKGLRGTMVPRLWGRAILLAALGQMGDTDAAQSVLAEMLAQRPEFSLAFTRKHYPIKIPAAVEHLVDGLRKAELPENSPQQDEPPPLPDKPSIAVLPFENMSADPEQEYFSDGITEDIITELSKISGLFVIARHSAFTYKGRSVTLKQVGEELGVLYALEGSVRKAGNRLRITAQLIDTATDHHLWAERYDRDIEDIFAVQDEIARHVADALAVALKPSEVKQLAHAPTANLDAYDFYLRARTSFWPPSLSNLLNARNAFSRVIEIDPEFAGGHAGTSISFSLAVRYGHSSQPEADAATALEMAQTAVALDADFARAHSALGLAYSIVGRHNEAVASEQRAIELQPGDTDGYWYLANCLNSVGNGEAARDAILTALRLDPQYVSGPYLNALGRANFIAGRYEDSIEAYERNSANGGPIAVPMLTCWTASYAALGRINEAQAKVREILTHEPNFSLERARQVWAFHSADAAKLLIEGLRKAGLPE